MLINDINVGDVIQTAFNYMEVPQRNELTKILLKEFKKAVEKRMQNVIEPQKERHVFFVIWMDNGHFKTELSKDFDTYQLYGFLKPFVIDLENYLVDGFVPRTSNDDVFM